MTHVLPPGGGQIAPCEEELDLRFYVKAEDVSTETPHIIVKAVLYFGKPCALVCDARCEKAWGINSRPFVSVGDDDDDFAYLADDELGIAPEDPGTYEGGNSKPRRPSARLNKWCARECERSVKFHGTAVDEVVLPDFSRRRYNMPEKHGERTEP